MATRTSMLRRSSRLAALLAGLLAVVVLAASCSSAASHGAVLTPLPPECMGVAQGSQVVVYSSVGLEFWYSDQLTRFQSLCRVQVYYEGLAAPDVLTRLRKERAHPLADIVVAPAPQIEGANQANLLAAPPAPGADAVPDDRCAPQRVWCELAETYTSWVYARGQINAPTKWTDLLKPDFSGQILYSPPDQNDASLAMIVLLRAEMGDTGAYDYLARLEQNVAAHDVSTDAMSKVVSSRTAVAANGDLQEHANDLYQYPGLGVWFPRIDGGSLTTLALPIGAGVARGTHNPRGAAALLSWLWTKPAQLGLSGANLSPGLPNLRPQDLRYQTLVSMLSGVTIMRADWTAVMHDAPGLLTRWAALRRAPTTNTAPVTTTTSVP